ncbi:MAG: hypothetical protein ACI89U_001681 [Gammaproteobacteria bacterium]
MKTSSLKGFSILNRNNIYCWKTFHRLKIYVCRKNDIAHTTSYSLSIEKIDRYAHAIVEGDHFDLDHLVKAFESISKYCIQHELAKVLIEDRIPVEWDLRDMELIATRAAPMFKGLKTAIYVHLDPNRLFLTLARQSHKVEALILRSSFVLMRPSIDSKKTKTTNQYAAYTSKFQLMGHRAR